MPFLGFGYSAFGTTPFGFGAVPASDSTTAQLFVKPDGTRGNAPLIDSIKRDYVLDATTGIKVGADSVPMMVEFALFTLKNSSAVLGFGLEAPNGLFSPDADRRADVAARAALAHLTKKKLISIQRVTLNRLNVRAAFIGVDWVNLATGETFFNQVALNGSA